MFLQTSMTTRRKFLERSAWGFGSMIVSSSLLQSCIQDHIIPPDVALPGVGTPLLGFEPDYNDDAKIIVKSLVEKIPEVGEVLGPLIDIFWPKDQSDVWDQIKEQVEALIDQEIADSVHQQVSEDLQGLNGSLTLYLDALQNSTPLEILSQWLITKNLFVNALPHFKSAGNELPLLPLFAQFANMFLVVLRDAVIDGQSWGRTPADHAQDVADLKQYIKDFTSYSWTTFKTGLTDVAAKAGVNNNLCEPFRSVNTYVRQMTLTAIDYQLMWPYFDVTLYPNGTTLGALREIYTDPFGNCDDSGNIVIASPQPTQLPTNLTVWAYDRVDAVQLTYPSGTGPGGVTTTPRMGDSGGTNVPPYGGSFNLSPNNPITQVRALTTNYIPKADDVVYNLLCAMQLGFTDGTTTNLFGTTKGSINGVNDSGWIGYANEAVSSMHINGVNKKIGSADCVVFGFHYTPSPASQLNAIRAVYVKTPKERSATDLAKEFPKVTIPANLITDELKAARKAYWAYIQARAKALK